MSDPENHVLPFELSIESDKLSPQAQAALDIFLDEYSATVPFKAVLEAVVNEAFHIGGDRYEAIMFALNRQISEGKLRTGMLACINVALDRGYTEADNGVDGDGTINPNNTCKVLSYSLFNSGPEVRVVDVLTTLVSDGLAISDDEDDRIPALSCEDPANRVSKETALAWLTSEPSLKSLEAHFKRLCMAHIPTMYMDLIRRSPVRFIAQYIRNNLIVLKSTPQDDGEGFLVSTDFTKIFSNIRPLIWRLLNAEDSGSGELPFNYTYEQFKVHFSHALAEARDLFKDESRDLDQVVADALWDTGNSINGAFDIELWDGFLKPQWDKAKEQERRLQSVDTDVTPPSGSMRSARGKDTGARASITGQNRDRAKKHGSAAKHRRSYSPPCPGRTPGLIAKPIEITAPAQVDKLTNRLWHVGFQLSPAKRLYFYFDSSRSGKVAVSMRLAESSEGIKKPLYHNLGKLRTTIESIKANGGEGFRRSVTDFLLGLDGVSSRLAAFGIRPGQVEMIPATVSSLLSSFTAGQCEN